MLKNIFLCLFVLSKVKKLKKYYSHKKNTNYHILLYTQYKIAKKAPILSIFY